MLDQDNHVVFLHGACKHHLGYENCWWDAIRAGCNDLNEFDVTGIQWNPLYHDHPRKKCECFPEGWVDLRQDQGERDVAHFLSNKLIDGKPKRFATTAIERCTSVIERMPINTSIHVIAHSLGTVVGYRALHELRKKNIRVKTFTTVGSVLAWQAFLLSNLVHVGQEHGRLRRPYTESWLNIMDQDDWVFKTNQQVNWRYYHHLGEEEKGHDLEYSRRGVNHGVQCNKLEWPKKDTKIGCDLDIFGSSISREEMCTHLAYFHQDSQTRELIQSHLLGLTDKTLKKQR